MKLLIMLSAYVRDDVYFNNKTLFAYAVVVFVVLVFVGFVIKQFVKTEEEKQAEQDYNRSMYYKQELKKRRN